MLSWLETRIKLRSNLTYYFITNDNWFLKRYVALKQQPKAKEWYKKAADLPYKGAAEEEQHNQAVSKAK